MKYLPLFLVPYLLFCTSSFAESSRKLTGTRPLPALPAGAFTIVVIPDTQSYRGKGCKATPDSQDPVTNVNLEAQVKWIRDHLKDQNIVFVSHVGDIVDKDTKAQWEIVKQNFDTLRGLVPFGLTVGNHDMSSKGDAHLFQQYFPASSFASYPWYLGSFTHDRADQTISANNVNSAQVFSAGGVDFIHLNLECNAPDDVLAWANALLTKNANRHALITTHMDLGVLDRPKTDEGYIKDPKGRMRWVKIHGNLGNTGEQMWDKLYSKHANLSLIFCGDQSRVTALKLTRPADDGHPVTSLLSDYLSQTALRLYRFVPAENRVHALTYDVVQQVLVDDSPYVHDLDQHQFTLDYAMQPAAQAKQ
jgi:hypothetical protein